MLHCIMKPALWRGGLQLPEKEEATARGKSPNNERKAVGKSRVEEQC